MNKFNKIIGFDKIKFLVADREFIGKGWLVYLNQNRIKYHIRIREYFDGYLPRNQSKLKASWLFNSLKPVVWLIILKS